MSVASLVDRESGKIARLLAVEAITIRDRHRQDLGDLTELVASMRELGLLQPIVVNANHELVAGQRRLAAWQIAAPGRPIWAHVASNLDDAARHLHAERDENSCRKPLTPSEMVSLGLSLEELERPAADARKQATQAKPGEGKVGGVKSTPPEKNHGKTRDTVAAALGISATTYATAKRVVHAAQDTSLPAAARVVAQHALERMDRTGVVDPAGKQVKRAIEGDAAVLNQSTKPTLPNSVGDVRSLGRKRDVTRLLGKVCEQLDGVQHVLDDIDLTKTEPTEVEILIDNLSRFRAVLSRTINQLRSLP